MNRWIVGALAALLAAGLATPSRADYGPAEADRLVNARDWNGALAYMQAWTKAKPDDAMGWFYLGNTYLHGFNRPADSVAPLQRATQLKPGWADALYTLGSAEVHADRPADAVAPLRQATALAPKNMLYWFMLGTAYNNAGRFNDQFMTLRQAERAGGPTADYAGWYDLGLQYKQIHACPQGIHAFQQAVRLKPDFGDGWNNLGFCDEEMGQLGPAQGAYSRAAQLGTPQAAANLARVNGKISVANALAREPAVTTGGYSDPAQLRLHDENCRAYGRDDQSARSSLGC